MAGVDERLDLLQCCRHGSSRFSSIQQDRFYCCVEDPDFDIDVQVRLGPHVIHLKEVCSCSADSYFYISVSPPLFVNNAT